MYTLANECIYFYLRQRYAYLFVRMKNLNFLNRNIHYVFQKFRIRVKLAKNKFMGQKDIQ